MEYPRPRTSWKKTVGLYFLSALLLAGVFIIYQNVNPNTPSTSSIPTATAITSTSTNSTLAIDLLGLPCSQLQYMVNKLLIPYYYYGFNSVNPAYDTEIAQFIQIYMHIMDEKGCPYA